MTSERQEPRSRRKRELPQERVGVDFVVLGDFAQAVGGKLTVVGGGWNVLNATGYPQGLPFGLGIGILVPWNETNRKHEFKFTIRAVEGEELASGGGEFEAGRQPGMPPGMTQRLVLGISGQILVPHAGTYEVQVIAGDHAKNIYFEAMPLQQVQGLR
jgi:hypothetical protein